MLINLAGMIGFGPVQLIMANMEYVQGVYSSDMVD